MALAPVLNHFPASRIATLLTCFLVPFLGVVSHAAELTLTWADNSDNETGFKVERRTESSAFSLITTVGANVENYTDTGLAEATEYWYQVSATNSAGDSGYTDPVSAVTAGGQQPNTNPTIGTVQDQTVAEDSVIGPLAVTVGDAETPASNLTLIADSSNNSVIPVSGIAFGGSGTSRTVTIVPTPDQSGSATITLTVGDGELAASNSFLMTVSSVNDRPAISDISNRSISEGGETGAIAFTVGDVDDSPATLSLSGTSSNTGLVPHSAIVFSGSGENRTVTVTPNADQSGSATITVTVSDGDLTASAAFVLAVIASPDPVTVAITSPQEGATFVVGDTISGEAITTDIQRTATVEFFHGSTRINTEQQSPYNFNWSPTSAGSYDLKAIVTDTGGASTDSPVVTITVTEPESISVALASPDDGATYEFGQEISVTGIVSDTSRASRVELLVDGSKIGEDLTAPYAFIWSGASAGSHILQLRAVDLGGGTVLSKTVSVTVNEPDLTVDLIQPLSGMTVDEGATVMLEASTSDDMRTSSVEFFVDGSSVGSASAKPYRLSWLAQSPGNHSIQAEAHENNGGKAQSRSATITVKEETIATAISLIRPTSDTALSVGDRVTIEAAVAANGASVGRVEFIVNGVKIGQAKGAPYAVDWVPLEPGEYTITARAVVPGGTNMNSVPLAIVVEASSGSAPVASGVYRGKFKKVKASADLVDGATPEEVQPDETGSFAIFVDEYGLMTFLGYDTESETGFVETGLKISEDGSFEIPGRAIGIKGDAAGPQAVPAFVRGRITSKGVSGLLDAAGLLIEGGKVAASGPSSEVAGSYDLLGVRSSDAQVKVIVAPDGLAFVLALSSTGIVGEEVAVAVVDQSAYMSSSALNLEIIIDSVEGGAQGIMTESSGEVSSLMGLRSDIAPIRRLDNISTRGSISSGDSVMITGFVVSGTEPKTMLIRAIGPGLDQFGVNETVEDPVLDLVGDSGVITSNARWTDGNTDGVVESVAARLGAFDLAAGSLDATLLVTVAPGRYSAVVRDTFRKGGSVLIEVYDATEDFVPGNDLINLSTRGRVGNGSNLIGGFVVTGNVPKRVLIRGIGPGLASFGIEDSLASTRLILTQRVEGADVHIAENSGWPTSDDVGAIQTASESAGAFLLDPADEDSALLIWLEPGVYTAQVEPGESGQSGTALIEIYQSE